MKKVIIITSLLGIFGVTAALWATWYIFGVAMYLTAPGPQGYEEPQQTKAPALSAPEVASGPRHLVERQIVRNFSYRNVHLRNNCGLTELVGEVRNGSGKSYDLAIFMVSVYDKEKQLLGTGGFAVNSFLAGQRRSFNALIDVPPSAVDCFKIDLEGTL